MTEMRSRPVRRAEIITIDSDRLEEAKERAALEATTWRVKWNSR